MNRIVRGITPDTRTAERDGATSGVDPEPSGLDTGYIRGGVANIDSNLIQTAVDAWNDCSTSITEAFQTFDTAMKKAMAGWSGESADKIISAVAAFQSSATPLSHNAKSMATAITSTQAHLTASKTAIDGISKGSTGNAGILMGLPGLVFGKAMDAKMEQQQLNQVVQSVHNPGILAVNGHKLPDLVLHQPVVGAPTPSGSNTGGSTTAGGGAGTGTNGGGSGATPAGYTVPANAKNATTKTPGNTATPTAAKATNTTPNASLPTSTAGAKTPTSTPLSTNNVKTPDKGLKTTPASVGGGSKGGGAGGAGGGTSPTATPKAARTAAAAETTAEKMLRSGKNGANGSNGSPMMGRGGGATSSKEGSEHKAAKYLVSRKNTDEMLGDAPMTAPPVIDA